LFLHAATAADLMTSRPLSVRETATVKEAVAFLTDHGISAAPVIDYAGQPVGVLSRSDVIVHAREQVDYLAPAPEFYNQSELTTEAGESLRDGFQVEKTDLTTVHDLMTPVIFSVSPRTLAGKVVEQMVDLKVHRLFVVDENGVLVGVISALDVLRDLLPGH
jgi:CBS domain-containing protein